MTRKQKKLLIRILTGAVLTVVMFFLPFEGMAKLLCCLVPYLILGYDILIKAGKGIISRQVFDESFLMAVATVGALVLGEYFEAVAVMLFFQIGELFESYAVGKSRKNIASLMDIRPDCANIEVGGELSEVPAEDVEVGTEIIIRPGERVPLDGVVLSGESSLDTRALTGESVPRSIKAGDSIFSGSVNLGGMIRVKTTKGFHDSTAGKILELIENASAKKSKSENFITRFARVYTPAVCVSALCLAVLPPLFRVAVLGSVPMWSEWLMRALNFLVISCPCALVISVPLSFFGGIGKASSMGILIKGSNYMETLSKMKYVLFDKTGTLTKGSFEVIKTDSENLSESELLYYAAAAENYSTHPIAESIRRAYGESVDPSEIDDIKEISGKGVTAVIQGKSVAVGNDKLLNDLGVKPKGGEDYGTIAYVVIDGEHEGYILISDTIKENSKKAVAELGSQGIKTVMLTGDREKSARYVSSELGISEVRSELLPQDKVAVVEDYISKATDNEKVAFAGDGINDAPVLTRADIGIAMGALGSDAAIEAADIVLMDDDPYKIVTAKKIAKKTLRIVKQNTVFAIGVKFLFLLLGALGKSNLWLAIFADVGVMVIAVLNAMRCMKK